MRRPIHPHSGMGLVFLLSVVIVSCGQSAGLITFDPIPTTTTTIPQTVPATTGASTVPPASTRAPVTATWQNATTGIVGLQSECGNLSLVSSRPDRDVLITSVAQKGLWASVDSTDTWTQLGSGAGSATITNRGSSLVYDPDHPDTIWESGIYNGGGVYRTDDNGQTWRQLGDIKSIDTVSVDLTDPGRKTLVASEHERTVVLRSNDGGSTWNDISTSLPTGIGFSASPVVVNASTFLLGTYHGNASAVFRTTDAGTTWTSVHTGGVIGLPVVSATDQAMYWLLDNSQGIIKSTDNGATWTQVTPAGVVSPLVNTLVQLPDGRLATVGNNIAIVSADGGVTWRSVGPAIPFSPNGMIYSTFRKAFYAWHFDCPKGVDIDPVLGNSIMRLAFDPLTN